MAVSHHHITSVLQELHWLPVDFHAQFKVMILTYTALYSLGPEYLNHFLEYKPVKCAALS